jgi:hypothetical protein
MRTVSVILELATQRALSGFLVGHFRKKLCNPVRGNCPTFIPKPLFLFACVVPPLGTKKSP